MYSSHHEGKSMAAERFIRNLQKKNYKYMSLISTNVHIDSSK